MARYPRIFRRITVTGSGSVLGPYSLAVQQKIVLFEEWGGRLRAAEMKWSPGHGVRAPGGWRQACPDTSFEVVHPKNCLDFISAPGGRRAEGGRTS